MKQLLFQLKNQKNDEKHQHYNKVTSKANAHPSRQNEIIQTKTGRWSKYLRPHERPPPQFLLSIILFRIIIIYQFVFKGKVIGTEF